MDDEDGWRGQTVTIMEATVQEAVTRFSVMAPAHQVHFLRDRETLPAGDSVRILAHHLPSAAPGDTVVLHQRGTDDELQGTVVDLVEDGSRFVIVTFDRL